MSTIATNDSWDSPVASSSKPSTVPRPAAAIKDDWDDSDESEPEDSRKIWEDANTKAPMPQLVAAPASTSSAPVLPSGAFAAPIRILKRAPAATDAATPAPDLQQSTYADKKAQYDAARQRIFAANEQTKGAAKQLSEGNAVARQPLGPSSGVDDARASEGSRGFAKRSRGRGRGATVKP
ncbi:unnamed protein product [Peniophora sp. CBMAI 1063]|nr:unnamed protein product [Peniophora sp. CBMAI 1063]